MNKGKYVFVQLTDFLPHRVFDRLVAKYEGDKYVRSFTCWNQMLCMIFGQQQTISIEPEPKPYKPTVIRVKATIDSMGIYLKYKDRYKETSEIREVEKVIEKEVNILKWWQKLLITLGIIFITLTAIKISVKILTKYRI